MSVPDPNQSLFLPVPRVPQSAAAAWPPADLLADLDPDAATVVAAADQVRADVHAAIVDLVDNRPGGAGWVAARQKDRDVLLDTGKRTAKTPKYVAALLDGEHTRYGTALALASTVSERLDALRGTLATDPLIKKVDDKRKQLDQQISDAAFAAFTAASSDRKGAGWTALEDFDRLAADGRRLVALRKWLTGETAGFDPSPAFPVSTSVFGWARDARTLLAGGTLDNKDAAA